MGHLAEKRQRATYADLDVVPAIIVMRIARVPVPSLSPRGTSADHGLDAHAEH